MELKKLELRLVDNYVAKAYIEKYHYSKCCGGISFALGHFYGNTLKNLIAYSIPVCRNIPQQIMEGGTQENTLELIRMISIDPKPKNLESYCISNTFSWIKINHPKVKIIVSYADNGMGHYGYCYQASGFTYYGQSRTTKAWFIDGKRMHEKTIFNMYGTSSYEKLKEKFGDRLICEETNETKSRYYFILSQTKKEKKQIQQKIKVESLPYPKGENKRYDYNDINDFSSKDSKDKIESISTFFGI